jgi:hypothetical protein
MAQAWEYQVILESDLFSTTAQPAAPLGEKLGTLGSEGWELVLARPEPPSGGGGFWVFKRPVKAGGRRKSRDW